MKQLQIFRLIIMVVLIFATLLALVIGFVSLNRHNLYVEQLAQIEDAQQLLSATNELKGIMSKNKVLLAEIAITFTSQDFQDLNEAAFALRENDAQFEHLIEQCYDTITIPEMKAALDELSSLHAEYVSAKEVYYSSFDILEYDILIAYPFNFISEKADFLHNFSEKYLEAAIQEAKHTNSTIQVILICLHIPFIILLCLALVFTIIMKMRGRWLVE